MLPDSSMGSRMSFFKIYSLDSMSKLPISISPRHNASARIPPLFSKALRKHFLFANLEGLSQGVHNSVPRNDTSPTEKTLPIKLFNSFEVISLRTIFLLVSLSVKPSWPIDFK